MRNKGSIQSQTIRNIIVSIFVAIFIAVLIYKFLISVEIKNVIEENEVAFNREIIYAKIVSNALAYSDDNGINRPLLDYGTIMQYDEAKLFGAYSYKPDSISLNGYLHYVRVDVLEPKTETVKEFMQTVANPPVGHVDIPTALRHDARGFPISIRYSKDDIRLGKLYVNIIKDVFS